jgi:TrmH family RNA methyltransferase
MTERDSAGKTCYNTFMDEMIVSLLNRRVMECRKLRQKKHRTRSGKFLAEGLRLAEEAVRSGSAEDLFFRGSFGLVSSGSNLVERERRLLERAEAAGCQLWRTDDRVFASMTETQSPQGVVAVARKRWTRLEDLALAASEGVVRECAVWLVLDGIQDPGNLGTMIRTAWAAGVRGVLCLPDTADPYEGKCVRASMGGIFHIPVITDVDWETLKAYCLADGITLAMADAAADALYYDISWPSRTALCVGNEARGFALIPREEMAIQVRIPLEQGAESLNAAVACGILLYEMRRGRNSGDTA